ncbi:MAG: hypothetical protein QM767_25560 [Anaeromyxobacter sp.]
MSFPRRILPKMIHFVTRNCSLRRFLLTPSAVTNQVVEYALAVAAQRTGVESTPTW